MPDPAGGSAGAPVQVPAEPPSIADGIARPLDPRFVPQQRVGGAIATASISAILLVALMVSVFAARLPAWAIASLALLWALGTAGLAWFSYRWPAIEHRYASYVVDARSIEIRRGVVWRSVIDVPRSRVQHTDVSQGPLERRYGLGTVVIFTAGTDYAQVALQGVDHATALRIRDHLLPRDDADAV